MSDPLGTRSLDMAVRDELPVTCLRLPSVLAECSEHDVDGEEGGRSNETGGRAEAAPAPLLRSVAEVCPDRIQDDVAAVLEELGVAFDQVRSIPALKDVAGTLVPLVEPLRVRAAEVAHACAPGGLRRLDEQVEMVRHRAVRVTVPGEPLDGTRKHPQPGLVIAVVTEQRPLQVPAREDVKEAPGDLRSEASGHATTVFGPCTRQARATTSLTDSAHLSRDLVPGHSLSRTRLGTWSQDSVREDTHV